MSTLQAKRIEPGWYSYLAPDGSVFEIVNIETDDGLGMDWFVRANRSRTRARTLPRTRAFLHRGRTRKDCATWLERYLCAGSGSSR